MYFYRLYTLFDITCTNVIRHPRTTENNYTEALFRRNQQRNWETLQQILSLRAQIYFDAPPVMKESCEHFSKKVFKKTRTWVFEFSVEQDKVYGDNLELLIKDCDGIPMIANLLDNAVIPSTQLVCYGNFKNVHIENIG